MIADPAVRSVRVAVALCDRFAELLKGPSNVSAHKQSSALVGVSGNMDDLSLRIGEVQQIYPEIWRHLDDARSAFAARGIDVTAFDQIRASEGIALGAAVDVKHTRYEAGPYSTDQVVKSANFNREGHARAKKAAQALMTATPDIPWAAIAKAEADDPNIKAFTRSTTTKRWIMIGVLGAVIAAPFIYVWNAKRQERNRIEARRETYNYSQGKTELSAGDRKALEKAIVEAKQTVEDANKAWDTVMTPEALAAIKPSGNPCEFQFKAPTPKAAESYVQYGNVDTGYGDAFGSFLAADPIRSTMLRHDEDNIESYERGVVQGYATPDDAAKLKKEITVHELVVVIDKEVEPVAGEGTTYTPGQVTGRAYVFSVPKKTVVCAGVIDVKNAPDLVTSPKDDEAKQMLFRDLEVRLRQALAVSLKSI